MTSENERQGETFDKYEQNQVRLDLIAFFIKSNSLATDNNRLND